MSAARKAAIIGGGVIGGGWAARFLLNGWDVAVFDPDPEAARKIGEVLTNARHALPTLYDRALPSEGRLRFHTDLAEAVSGADWVQESVPERLDLKHKVHGDLTRLAAASAVIGSSTSGFKPSELTAQGARVIVAHPFNPVYLLPLVELVGAPDGCARAADILRGIGMYPLQVRKEIDAHIADRLLEAVWRESLWLVKDGIATTEEVDEAIRMGFGLRWAQMGLFETYRIAGGEAGMKHFMAQFGPALAWPWTKLMDVPEFNDALVDLIADQSDAQSGHLSIRELERLRDDNLVGILRALKRSGSGAGGVITTHETALPEPDALPGELPITLQCAVPQGATGANGQMTQAGMLDMATRAGDLFLHKILRETDAGHGAFVPVESTIRVHTAIRAGERATLRTRVLSVAAERLCLQHELSREDGTLAATISTNLIRNDPCTGQHVPMPPGVTAALMALAHAHAEVPQGGAPT